MTDLDIKERIIKVLAERKDSKSSIVNGDPTQARKIQRQIKGETKTLSVSTIIAFLEAYPEISAEWLLRGNGQMTIDPASIESRLQRIEKLMNL